MHLQSDLLKAYNASRNNLDAGKICHAPFNNMFFGNRGYVLACCFNKVFVMGRYPENTIEDIWNGEKANELRTAISANNLSKGCTGCLGIIENKNFGGVPAATYDNLSHKDMWPKRFEFELTNTCNLECIMCTGELSSSIRERRERKPPIESPYDDNFLQQLDPFMPHLETAQFLGGEPFLIPVYFSIWEKLIKLNPQIRINVQTNGSILNTRVKNVLENLRVSVSVSIDSLDKDVYPTIRVNGVLERVLANIEYFADYTRRKQTNLSFSFCPMVQNWREIPAITQFANKHNALVFFNTVSYPAECSLMNLPPLALQEIIDYLHTVTLPAETAKQKANKERFFGLINELKGYKIRSANSNVTDKERVSYEQWLQQLKSYTWSKNNTTEQENLVIYNTLLDKLNFVLQKAEEDNMLDAAKAGLAGINVAEIHRSLLEVENLDRVYLLFKERILKVV